MLKILNERETTRKKRKKRKKKTLITNGVVGLLSYMLLSGCAPLVANQVFSPQTSMVHNENIYRTTSPSNSIGPFSEKDLDLMVRTAYGEVRAQSDKEIKAVCQVIYNRWESGVFGPTIEDVVFYPKAFSVYNYDDQQRTLLLDAMVVAAPGYDRVYGLCTQVVRERVNGVDNSKGITHFYHPGSMKLRCVHFKLSHKKKQYKAKCNRWKRLPPKWSYQYEYKVRIGAGFFFKKEL